MLSFKLFMGALVLLPTLNRTPMYPALADYIKKAQKGMASIPEDRKTALREIADFVRKQTRAGKPAKLVFICTHNSRRSHMSQIWAATAAAYYGISGVETYSGGTEATAFNPRAVAAITRAGFVVENPGGQNPRYQVSYSPKAKPLECFSKIYSDPYNPQSDFMAVMTCSQADEACPIVRGASARVSLPYLDPKVADNTPEEAAKYDERCLQIATEMLYLMSQVK